SGLTDRDLPYVVAVKGSTGVHRGDARPQTPPRPATGRPPTPRYPDPPRTCKDLVLDHGEAALRQVTWRHGSKTSPTNPNAELTSRFTAIRVRPSGRTITPAPDGTLPELWLLAEWPTDTSEPTDYWLSTLPPDTPITDLVRLAKIRWRIEHDYRELKDALGLDHFEGRSWLGWHHHATLTTAAHLFLTTLRLTTPKAGGQD
ncbi:IS701 family transposase, partial [Nocardia sp. NPDC004711]